MTRHITEEQNEIEDRRIDNENEYGSAYYRLQQRIAEANAEWEDRDDQ